MFGLVGWLPRSPKNIQARNLNWDGPGTRARFNDRSLVPGPGGISRRQNIVRGHNPVSRPGPKQGCVVVPLSWFLIVCLQHSLNSGHTHLPTAPLSAFRFPPDPNGIPKRLSSPSRFLNWIGGVLVGAVLRGATRGQVPRPSWME